MVELDTIMIYVGLLVGFLMLCGVYLPLWLKVAVVVYFMVDFVIWIKNS